MFIGISGKMGTGKDYIIENYIKLYIENKLNKKCLILSFADMIKVNLMVHHNINMNAPNRNEKRLRNESINDENYEKIKNHQSETELDDFKFDIIIDNDIII
jgi:hypothetical protein